MCATGSPALTLQPQDTELLSTFTEPCEGRVTPHSHISRKTWDGDQILSGATTVLTTSCAALTLLQERELTCVKGDTGIKAGVLLDSADRRKAHQDRTVDPGVLSSGLQK